MPPTYDAVVKAARMTATRDGVAGGTLEVLSAGNTVLAVFTLTAGAGTVAADIWTLALAANEVNGALAAGDGTIATKARIKNSGGTVRISGLTVGLPDSTADLKLVNIWISKNQPVKIAVPATFQHAPDPA